MPALSRNRKSEVLNRKRFCPFGDSVRRLETFGVVISTLEGALIWTEVKDAASLLQCARPLPPLPSNKELSGPKRQEP